MIVENYKVNLELRVDTWIKYSEILKELYLKNNYLNQHLPISKDIQKR